jgi:PAS domain S-box-containing protein
MTKRTHAKPKQIQLQDLRARLAELEDTLSAIRSGEVDALIVNGPRGDQVYSLKGAEQPYRAFIEQMHEGAVTLDTAGTILYCNKRFAEMLALPLERVIGGNILDHIATDHRPLAASMIADTLAASDNLLLQSPAGLRVPVRFAVSPLDAGDDETAPARALIVTDLTEQHERKILSDALEKLQVSQTALRAQYDEVQATRRALEAAGAAKDEFLAALSHELRTPLTPVLLTANALAVDPSLPPELRSDLEMIRRNVELEARLIDDLLDLTRITRGKLQIAAQPVDLHDLLRIALDICQSDTAAKRLRFSLQLRAKHHTVHAEAVRLQQVFWNLIRNAVKFTPGAGAITVATRNTTSKNGRPHIVVTVTDTGIGISAKALKTIFNAFDQGSIEINRQFGGLGLGLTITKRLVDLHGGTIHASSAGKNKGARFTLTLPTIPAPTPASAAAAPTPARNARSLRILLVEDHDDTRRNMTRLLSALHHTVTAAPDAASALKQAAKHPFDLVVSDIGLPDQSGLELMKKLRDRHNLAGICLSGYGMEDDIARSRDAGFLQHLTKPINFQRLEQAITTLAESLP